MISCEPFGSEAILVNFDQVIDPDINSSVIALQNYMKGQTGITYQIPAYCSLTIGFNKQQTSFETLKNLIAKFEPENINKQPDRRFKIPVCYEDQFAPDLEDVSQLTQLSPKEIIEKHTALNYRIYMMGFIPGFAYMGRIDDQIQCKRKDEPRRRVPAQSVGIAGQQTGIYPSEGPGGWQLIGTTPITPLLHDDQNPFLFKSGDEVQFYAINTGEYQKIEQAVKKGKFDFNKLYVTR